MHGSQLPIRQLWEAISGYRGTDLSRGVLIPWEASQPGLGARLKRQSALFSDPERRLDQETSWWLYALSRVSDALLSRAADPNDPFATEDYGAFMERLGFTTSRPASFHPFFMEITACQADTQSQRPTVHAWDWPCVTVGNMLMARGGARVRAHPSSIDPALSASSVLFWAHTRHARETEDLSMGWGGNSQWRTRFRRDVWTDRELHYNVDARPSTNVEEHEQDDLRGQQAIEVLRFRCLVSPLSAGVSAQTQRNWWPWDMTHTEER